MGTALVLVLVLAPMFGAAIVIGKLLRANDDYPEPGCVHCAAPLTETGYCPICKKTGLGVE